MKAIILLFASLFALSAHGAVNDLDMFGLKGAVDSICIIMDDAGLEWQTEFAFDEDGMLIEIDGSEVECTRDKQGRISSITVEDAVEDNEDEFTTIEMKLTYDSAGHVIKVTATSQGESWVQNYRYDSRGLLKEHDYDGADQDEAQKYEYLEFAAHGNWTLRHEKLESMDQTIVQKRNITYRN